MEQDKEPTPENACKFALCTGSSWKSLAKLSMASQSITGCQGIKVKWWKRCLPEVIGRGAGSRWCCWTGEWSTMSTGWLAQRHIVTVVHCRWEEWEVKVEEDLPDQMQPHSYTFVFCDFFGRKQDHQGHNLSINKGRAAWHDMTCNCGIKTGLCLHLFLTTIAPPMVLSANISTPRKERLVFLKMKH